MSTVQILPDRLERFLRPDFRLRSGIGKGINSHVDVCVMQAADWLAGGQSFSDAPDCVPATITSFLIRLNDSWLFGDEYRQSLKVYAPQIIGLDKSLISEKKRGFIAADHAVRKLAPMWLRFAQQEGIAATLEAVPPVVDRESALIARDVAKKSQTDAAAYAFGAAALAAAAAADSALAAAALAFASAASAAALAAASAAYSLAAADAVAAVSFCASLRSAAMACLDEMIGVTP